MAMHPLIPLIPRQHTHTVVSCQAGGPQHGGGGGRPGIWCAASAAATPVRYSHCLLHVACNLGSRAVLLVTGSCTVAKAVAGTGRRDPVLELADAIAAEYPRIDELKKEASEALHEFVAQQKQDPDSPELALLNQRFECIRRDQAALAKRVAEMRLQAPGAAAGQMQQRAGGVSLVYHSL